MLLVMAAAVSMTTLFCSVLLYEIGLERAEAHLIDIVKSQVAVVGAVAEFDARFSDGDHPQGAMAATLAQVDEAYQRFNGVGETGEFLVGQRQGDMIFFVLHSSEKAEIFPDGMPWDGRLAEPMRRALEGRSGAMVGLDYKGEEVMAAYGLVEKLGVGIVAKIDMAELRAPYLHAVGWSLLVAVLLTLIGGVKILRLWRPVYARIIEQNNSLHKSKTSLAKAQKITHIGSWDWDVASNELWWSDEIYRIFGLQPQTFAATYDAFVSHIHPDDVAKVQAAVAEALESASVVYQVEHRVVRPDGEVRYVVERGDVLRDAAGLPVSMMGTVQDITERKSFEEKLLLSDHVFRTTSEGIVVTMPDARIVSVNKAFTDITGYSSEEVIGRNPSLMQSGRQDKEFYSRMWRALENEGVWSGEVWDRRKDGSEFPKRLTINSVRNDTGEVLYYVGVFSDITKAKESEVKLLQLAFYDNLTNLPNRVLCSERVEHGLRFAVRHDRRLAILFLDLDRFKIVNDSLGHSCGDILLAEAANRITRCVRETDTVSRLGGDEFIVVLNDVDDVKSVERIAKKIISVLGQQFVIQGHEVNIGVSIGVSLFPDNGKNFDELTKNADAAMYKAKESGRNQFCYFTEELQGVMLERLSLESELRKAIEEDELLVYYQSKVHVRTGDVICVEALVRWESPTRGLVMPGAFIAIAEETGLIVPLGDVVLAKACRQLVQWRALGCGDIKVAVNLSPRQFERDDLVEKVSAVLAQTGLPAQCLELEVTESMVMHNMAKAIVQLDRLCALGVSISIDDFGTGYSSLSYLKRLPIQTLKVDRSFVEDLGRDDGGEAIVSAVISMATTLGLDVVAEGVETDMQLEFLRKEGCDYVQGFLMDKPAPPMLFERYLDLKVEGFCLPHTADIVDFASRHSL